MHAVASVGKKLIFDTNQGTVVLWG